MAAAYFQAAVALRPDAAAPFAHVGALLQSQKRWHEALPFLKRALRLDPQDADTSARLGSVLSAIGGANEAIAQYEAALRLNPRMSNVHTELGLALRRVRRINDAVEQFHAAIQLDPRDTWPRYNLADALCQLGRPSQAIDQLRELVAINPQDEPAQYRLSQLLLDDNRLEEARLAWQKALETRPHTHAHWFGYAELCLFLDNADEYRRNRFNLLALFADSKDPTVCERTAKACLLLPWDTTELQQAAHLADRAEVADRTSNLENHPYDVFAQGLAAYRLGRLDEAITLMRGKAAAVTPPCPKLVIAMAMYKKGDRDQAQAILSEAVRSFDWNKPAGPTRIEEFWVSHILRREAESMVHPQRPSTSPN
jgi:serine/threonine-protein kinase